MFQLLQAMKSVKLRPVQPWEKKEGVSTKWEPIVIIDYRASSFHWFVIDWFSFTKIVPFSSSSPVPPRFHLRPVTRHESIIADAMRERLKTFRPMLDDRSKDESSGDWSDEDANTSRNSSHGNVGVLIVFRSLMTSFFLFQLARSFLRKVDPSQLPKILSEELFSSSPHGDKIPRASPGVWSWHLMKILY